MLSTETLSDKAAIRSYILTKGTNVEPEVFIPLVSKIYHDIEARLYDASHAEIFEAMTSSCWESALLNIATRLPGRIRVLDLGSGTGFASQQLLRYISANRIESLICLDTSPGMLRQCKNNLQSFNCHVEYMCGDIESINKYNTSFDLVLTNSVVHHVLDLPTFFSQISALIARGGFYIMGHEPNTAFYSHSSLQRWMRLYRIYRKYRRHLKIYALLERLGISGSTISIYDALNEQLLKDGITVRPMELESIRKMIDIHVPISSGRVYWGKDGFDPVAVNDEYLTDFQVIFTKTYHHIKEASSRLDMPWVLLNRYLAKKHPDAGADFIAVYRKTTGR